jgi:uncharacterized protein YcfJ
MKKTILGLAAAGLVSLAAIAADPSPAPPPPDKPATPPAAKPAPPQVPEQTTTYGDSARVLSSFPIHDRVPTQRECRLEQTGYNTAATEVAPCDKSATRERVVAYDVTYEYNGHQFRTRMPYQPGERIAVNVDVRPPMPRGAPGPNPSRYRGPY